MIQKLAHLCLFLSTLSLRRATGELQSMPRVYRISIHALLAESDGINRVKRLLPTWISIHALLAESDDNYIYNVSIGNISIHALLAESDGSVQVSGVPSSVFLSTLSLRRATLLYAMGDHRHCDFYPRSPCGERPCPRYCTGTTSAFLSTLSLRRATGPITHSGHPLYISIHALLAESDGLEFCNRNGRANFYPRSPCGERRLAPKPKTKATEFLSTLSLRRATP